MKRTYIIWLIILASCNSRNENEIDQIPPPPTAPSVPAVEVKFGREITDPYRNLEDLKNQEVLDWLKQQSEYAETVIQGISGRDRLIKQMEEFDERKKASVYSITITPNDHYFYLKRTEDDQTGKLFHRNGFDDTEKLLFDPEGYGVDSLSYSLSGISAANDGSKVSFLIGANGSENNEILTINVPKGSLYKEKLTRIWQGGISYLPDNESFFYHRVNSTDVHDPKRNDYTKVFLHKVGEEQSSDKEIFSYELYPNLDIEKGETPIIFTRYGSPYLYAMLYSTSPFRKVYYLPIEDFKSGKGTWSSLLKPEDKVTGFDVVRDTIYFGKTNDEGQLQIYTGALSNFSLSQTQLMVEAPKEGNIQNFQVTADGLYYTIAKNGVTEELYFKSYDQKRPSRKIDLPVAASSINLATKGGLFSELWVYLSGWTTPYQRFNYDLNNDQFISENFVEVPKYPEYEDLIVEELMIPSHDSVLVPLSLVYKKDVNKSKKPVLMYGYGAYGYSLSPFFDPNLLLWVNEGGMFAVPHVRGGSELGQEWHRDGQLDKKPNSWKDLIACAEYLVENNYTNPDQIALNGGSAAGILLGRAMTERPELFGAVIVEVGFLNPIRVEGDPLASMDIPEFGDVETEDGFKMRYDMDAYHHLKPNTSYPAAYITAGMNDPRVLVWHPSKFAARLQTVNSSDNPVLLHVDMSSGHGVGDNKNTEFEKMADMLSFGLWQTGHPKFNLQIND